MIFGHLTATYALRQTFVDKAPVMAPLLPLLTGALLPDLFDKPVAILFGLPGRGLAHSAVLLAVVFYLLLKLLPREEKVIKAVAVGAFLHLAEDFALLAVTLWPLLGPWPVVEHVGLLQKLVNYYLLFTSPVQAAFEFFSYPFCLYFLYRNFFSLPRVVDQEG